MFQKRVSQNDCQAQKKNHFYQNLVLCFVFELFLSVQNLFSNIFQEEVSKRKIMLQQRAEQKTIVKYSLQSNQFFRGFRYHLGEIGYHLTT